MKSNYLLGIVTIVAIIWVGCSIKSPSAFTWDVDLKVPLLKTTDYSASDLLKYDYFEEGDDGELVYLADGEIDPSYIDDGDLKISPNLEGTGWELIAHDVTIAVPLYSDDPDAENNAQIVWGKISSGTFKYEFRNLSSNIEHIDIIFDELRSSHDNNDLVSHRVTSNALTTGRDEQLLNEKFIGEYKANFDDYLGDIPLEYLHITLEVHPPTATGEIRMFYDESITFSNIVGILDDYPVEAESEPINIDFDYPINLENVMLFLNTELTLEIESNLGFDFRYTGWINAKNTRSDIDITFYIDEIIPYLGSPYTHIIPLHLSPNNYPLEAFISIAPDVVEMTDIVYYIGNRDGSVGFADVNPDVPTFVGLYDMRAPLNLRLTYDPDNPVMPANPDTIKISQKNREEIKKRARDIEMTVKFDNYFTADANVVIFLSSSADNDVLYKEDKTTYVTPDSDMSTNWIIFGKGEYDGRGYRLPKILSNGDPSQCEYKFHIPREQIPFFHKYDAIYYGMQITFDDSDNTTVNINDFIRVTANLIAKIFIEIDED